MDSKSKEKTLVDNKFGKVTTEKVIYYPEKGWFSGGQQREAYLEQVTAVRQENSTSLVAGLIETVIGVALLVAIGGAIVVELIGIILLLDGLLKIWGSPSVTVVTSQGTHSPSKGFPWDRQEATQFVSALRNPHKHLNHAQKAKKETASTPTQSPKTKSAGKPGVLVRSIRIFQTSPH